MMLNWLAKWHRRQVAVKVVKNSENRWLWMDMIIVLYKKNIQS